MRSSLPVFLLSALLFALGAGAAWYVQHLYADLSEVLELNVTSVRAAEELEIGLREIRTRLNDYAARGDEAAVGSIPELRAVTDRWLSEAVRLATTPHEKELIERVTSGYRHFFGSLDALLRPSHDDAAMDDLRRLVDAILTREIIGPAHEYLDYNETTMLAVAREHRIFSKRIAAALLALGVFGATFGFCAGVLAARRLRRSVVELSLPLSLAAGKLSEVVGPVRLSTGADLSDLKAVVDAVAVEVERVVLRLQDAQRKALRAEKLAEVGQLAAGTAHEIRNPLMAIKLLVQSARAKGAGGSELTDDDLCLMESEIGRVERTVQNLLDYARPPAPTRQAVPVAGLLERCLQLVAGRAQLQRVTLALETPGNAATVDGDPQQLQQVVLNLLMNALDATPAGGAVALASDTATGGAVRIAVRDSGQGIPAHLLPVVFEPFVSGKPTGVGLGLSITKQIVEAHRGQVYARAREPRGAEVGFVLPLSAAVTGGMIHATP